MNLHPSTTFARYLSYALLLLLVVVFAACSSNQTTEPVEDTAILEEDMATLNRVGNVAVKHFGTARLKPTDGSDAVGAVRLAILEDNTLSVLLKVLNLEPGSAHANHIHSGSCKTGGPVVWGLKDVGIKFDGSGGQDTWFHLTDEQVDALVNGNHFVAVHEGPSSSPGAIILCGNIHWR